MTETPAAQPHTALLERPPIVRPEVTDELLADITARIVAAFHPYRIILFGSYAYGTPHADSDVDLLVVMEKPEGAGRVMPEVNAVARVPNLEMDILIYSPAELETRLAMNDFFVVKMIECGRTLYNCGKMWDKQEITITMSLFDEWVERAEKDYRGAVRDNRLMEDPDPENVCFRCQQSAGKYLEAFLIRRNEPPPRTHDLERLLDLCAVYDATLQSLAPLLVKLARYAVDPRYPGFTASTSDAQEAVEAAGAVREVLRKNLGL